MYYGEDDFHITYRKGCKRAEEAVEFLSHPQRRLKVSYEDRKEILKAFVPLLIDKNKERGLTGVMPLARALHQIMDFMDADGGTNVVNAECIEKELNRIYREMTDGK